ncbi:MAG TPA: riboflavin synthase [Candidatus Saccharimonadales bacterium]|nr:riboflavin synthase [Candidatus Saccharimonadales bacterium]
MFTGLVEAVGRVTRADREANGLLFEIEAREFPELGTGASVSVLGCCHTVIAAEGARFRVRSMDETLRRTVLGDLKVGSRVNLERSLRIGAELGGHLVAGHIDGVGTVEEVEASATETRVAVRVPPELARFVAEKGSLCVDGVSLTVGEVSGSRANVYLIPYTLEHTVADAYRTGTRVNLEVDLVARYVARLLEFKV